MFDTAEAYANGKSEEEMCVTVHTSYSYMLTPMLQGVVSSRNLDTEGQTSLLPPSSIGELVLALTIADYQGNSMYTLMLD